jgi:adenosylcobinamide-phosphate synthase
LASWLLDAVLGDPPNRWHPVAWQGRFLAWTERHAPRARDQGTGVRNQEAGGSEMARFAWGAGVLLTGMGLSGAAAWVTLRVARNLPWPLRLLIEAGLLKLTLASHGLDRAAGEVEAALRRDNVPAAQRLLSWHLVSRDTRDLSAEEVTTAATESVAENLTDAFVAPLCAYVAGGLPCVWAYRFAQTADSMWGYHDEKHEWLGKPAARLDDALNWLPARLAAGLLTMAAWFCGEDAANAWRTRRSQAGNTASPNAGQTMATMAGALGVTLTKRGHYTLAGGAATVTPDTLARARRITRLAAGLAVAAATIVAVMAGRLSHGRR